MLNNSQLIKRKQQINLHRRVPEKKHPYLLRIPQSDFEKLQAVADTMPMSEVLIQGLRTEWNYHLAVQNLMKELPDFKTKKISSTTNENLKLLNVLTKTPIVMTNYRSKN